MKGIIANNRNRLRRHVLIGAFALSTLQHAAIAGGNFHVVNLPPKESAVYELAAEDAYRHLATWWFDKPHPDLWRPKGDQPPVPITVRLQSNTSGGGATTFRLEGGQVFGWSMTVVGTPRQILSNVLPHEVGHVVLYTRFRRPLGRCLDEGCATIGESAREHAAYRNRVADALRRRRIIPFGTLLDASRYPREPSAVQTMYAQSHSLVEFLLQRNGRQHFVSFLADRRKPTAKLREFYSVDAEELQTEWRDWFRANAVRGFECKEFGCRFHAAAADSSYPRPVHTSSARVIYAFTADWCSACRPFKRDVSAGKFRGYRFEFVDPDRDKKRWKQIAAKMAAETGHRAGIPLPSWWVPGTKKLVVMRNGYSAPGLLQILGGLIRGLMHLIDNPDVQPGGSPPGTRPGGEGTPASGAASAPRSPRPTGTLTHPARPAAT